MATPWMNATSKDPYYKGTIRALMPRDPRPRPEGKKRGQEQWPSEMTRLTSRQ